MILPNAVNASVGDYQAEVVQTERHDILVVTGRRGPSVMNTAETTFPELAQRLGLTWMRCLCVERRLPDKARGERSARCTRVEFARGRPIGHTPLPGGQSLGCVPVTGWSVLPVELAARLMARGIWMTDLVGRRVHFHATSQGAPEGEHIVRAYDGLAYHTDAGLYLEHHIRRVPARARPQRQQMQHGGRL